MPDLLDAGLPAPAWGGFTMRTGGVSKPPWDALDLAIHVGDSRADVLVNRRLLADALGCRQLAYAEQVHGAGVAVLDRPPGVAGVGAPGVDALVTASPGLGLVVLAADCLPVLLADPRAGVVAAVHAGRSGLTAGVLQSSLAAMAGLGATPAGISAVLGPSVCGRCYELPAELADEVGRLVPGSRDTTRRGTPSVDLAAGAEALLRTAGVSDVSRVGGCTLEQPERFYSFRRDGRTGRHAGVVRLGSSGAGS